MILLSALFAMVACAGKLVKFAPEPLNDVAVIIPVAFIFPTGDIVTAAPTVTFPSADTRSLSLPSVVTLKCPSDPVSTTSASVFPSVILSELIVLQVAALPEPPLVSTCPDEP